MTLMLCSVWLPSPPPGPPVPLSLPSLLSSHTGLFQFLLPQQALSCMEFIFTDIPPLPAHPLLGSFSSLKFHIKYYHHREPFSDGAETDSPIVSVSARYHLDATFLNF